MSALPKRIHMRRPESRFSQGEKFRVFRFQGRGHKTNPAIAAAKPTWRYPTFVMPTVPFDVPEGALSALRLSPPKFVKEMRIATALLWYSRGEITQSKAAEIAGNSRAGLIDELAHRRIPVVQATPEELNKEMLRD
jgi:hypothetical protein